MVERDELHRRIMALRDAMAEGKLVFAEHLADAFRETLAACVSRLTVLSTLSQYRHESELRHWL